MIKFDKEKVLLLQQLLTQESGGSAGVRDMNLLDSALESIFATFDGKDLYPTKEEKGARLGFALVSNHAFIDGNKRIGLHIMILFLAMNGVELNFKHSELVNLGFDIANGKVKYEQLLNWINKHKILKFGA
jgi:death-on-curing protein